VGRDTSPMSRRDGTPDHGDGTRHSRAALTSALSPSRLGDRAGTGRWGKDPRRERNLDPRRGGDLFLNRRKRSPAPALHQEYGTGSRDSTGHGTGHGSITTLSPFVSNGEREQGEGSPFGQTDSRCPHPGPLPPKRRARVKEWDRTRDGTDSGRALGRVGSPFFNRKPTHKTADPTPRLSPGRQTTRRWDSGTGQIRQPDFLQGSPTLTY
jgi:hypothetical protein